MRTRQFLGGAAIAIGLATAPLLAHSAFADPSNARRECATPEPTAADREAARSAFKAFMLRGGLDAPRGGEIQVAWHVIHDGAKGNVPLATIEAQMAELNRAFRGADGGVNTGYRFTLASVDRTDDKRWFKLGPGTGDETHMKQALAIDPAHRLNVYSASLTHYLVGWAYFPQSLPEDHYLHGVVVHYGSLPGGDQTPYDLGKTLDHEVGHYLGLFHTFQGGCTEPGDEVADTPAMATPTRGCPEGKDTCPAAGLDPIHNYMDYSDDLCYTEFSAGQDARMDVLVPAYRPSLLNASAASAALGPARAVDATIAGRALSFEGAARNPFAGETQLFFALPAAGVADLSVYNVAGQRVATLLAGEAAAGPHRVTFRANDLSPGMYFAALRFGGRTLTRSVIVVR